MPFTYLGLIFWLLMGPSAQRSSARDQISPAIAVLRASTPGVEWDAKSVVIADITADGIQDRLAVGYDADSVWIGLVPGTKHGGLGKPVVQQFFVGRHTQGSLCQKPVHLELRPASCEDDAGPLPGCHVAKVASEFSVVDDACDLFHFYWNKRDKSLAWWRR